MQKEYDYSGLPEMAKILTNNNGQAVSDMALLARDPGAFLAAYPEWCEEMEYDADMFEQHAHETIRDTFAYWLCGYEGDYSEGEKLPRQFDGYMDWKTETEDIISNLEGVEKKPGKRPEQAR